MGEIIYRVASPIRVLPYNVTRTILRADTGAIEDIYRGHNKVLNTGLEAIWRAFAGVGPAISTFAIGTGATEPGPEDMGPGGEVLRSDLSRISASGPILQCEYYLGSSACNGLTLQSAMLLAGDVPVAWIAYPAATKSSQYVWVFQWQIPLEQVV